MCFQDIFLRRFDYNVNFCTVDVGMDFFNSFVSLLVAEVLLFQTTCGKRAKGSRFYALEMMANMGILGHVIMKMDNRGKPSLSLVLLKVGSLLAATKCEMLRLQLQEQDFDIVGLSETWLSEGILTGLVNMKGYNVV